MRRLSALVAVIAAVAAFGLAAGSASAADSPTLVDDAAARLGIAPDRLRAAFREARAARIDAAVQAGKLTPEQGARLGWSTRSSRRRRSAWTRRSRTDGSRGSARTRSCRDSRLGSSGS